MPKTEALNQFALGLSDDDAKSVCGPVAAIAFAQANGRNPTLTEARQIARETGWTQEGGMNGIANQKRLLDRMGVASRLDTNPSTDHIIADASSGNPVIISTAKHYYYVNDYNPKTNQVYVGETGVARRGGSRWMTVSQIAELDGGINGALFVDNPSTPGRSVANEAGDTPTQPGAPPMNPNQKRFNEIIAAKGDPTGIEILNEFTEDPEDPRGPKLKNPSPKYRYKFGDGTYLDATYHGPNVGGVGAMSGTALTSLAAEARKTAPRVTRDPIVGGNTSDEQYIVTQKPDGSFAQISNPNYVAPSSKQFIIRQMSDGTTATEPNPNYVAPKRVTRSHATGNKIYTVDEDGIVISTIDVPRDPLDDEHKKAQTAKLSQELMGKQQLALQQQAETVKMIQGMLERGEIDITKATAYMEASRVATDAAMQGTTPFEMEKFTRAEKRARESEGADLLKQRISSGSSLASSLMSAALGAAQKAMFRPGQTSIGYNPMADARSLIQGFSNDATGDPTIARLLSGSGPGAAPAAAPLPAGL